MRNIFRILLMVIIPFFVKAEGKVILKETFSYPDGPLPALWWSEGCSAKIKDGHLFVDADTASFRQSTIWLDQELSGDLSIEFDVHIVASSDKANNINCFFLYSQIDGEQLKASCQERIDGNYTKYHNLKGYIFTNVRNGDGKHGRFRLRDNPGFYLLAEEKIADNRQGKTYHVKIEKNSERLRYWIDGHKVIDLSDDFYNPLYNNGIFGFRTWHTALWWDNLVITQLD